MRFFVKFGLDAYSRMGSNLFYIVSGHYVVPVTV